MSKEAVAIVLDVGPSMNQAPDGGTTSLQSALAAIGMILQRKMFAESKDEISLILCGTPETANELADDDAYQNITVARPLGLVDWDLLQFVQNEVDPSDISGDFLDALVVAMDHIVKDVQGKRGFGSKRIILFTDCGGEFGDDKLDDIMGSFKEAEIELNIIGPNLDDDQDSSQDNKGDGDGKRKTPQQLAGETLLNHMMQQVNGESYSFSEALPALSFFQSRQVKQTAWKCSMEIGSDMKVPINLFSKIKEAKPKSYKNVYAKDADAEIERVRSHHLNDEEETEIEKSDIVDGHRYGSTLVPFTSEDKDAMKYPTEKCFKVLGFTKTENIKIHHKLGDTTWVVTADKGDDAAGVAMSALIKALYETNAIGIVRRVYANNSPVRLGCLVPNIKPDYECFFYNELPFCEDIRQFTFSSLPVKEDVEYMNIKFAPSNEQLNLMDSLIDEMDLSACQDDEEEALKPKVTFNPHLQRLYQCLQNRALNPDDPMPELSSVVAKSLSTPSEVVTKCQQTVEKMENKYKLVQIVKKKDDNVAGNIFKDDNIGGDGHHAAKKLKLDDDLGSGMADIVRAKITEVGTVKPVNDFLSIISDKEVDRFEEACRMMIERILQLVSDSFGDQLYGKAIDCLTTLRKQAIKNGEPNIFNKFLDTIKNRSTKKDNTIRKDFWEEIIQQKISLISKVECEESNVSHGEANVFLRQENGKDSSDSEPEKDDADDLLAQL